MLVLTVSFFIVSLLLFSWLLTQVSSMRRNKEKRLNFYLADDQDHKELLPQKIKKESPVSRLLKRLNQRLKQTLRPKKTNGQVEHFLQSAGMTWSPGEYVAYRLISAAILGSLCYLVFSNVLLLVVGAFAGYFYPKLVVGNRRKKRIKRFNEGLADVITSLINSLRAGFSFLQALKSVEEEAETPIKEEIGHVLKEMQYGSSLEEALIHLTHRMPSEDLDIFVQAVLIQRQVGGNLATVLSSIVETIRERIKIQRQVKTLTAQGKMSGIVIGALPFALGGVITIISPTYMSPMFHSFIGIMVLVGAFVSGMIGFVLIQKITKIEV